MTEEQIEMLRYLIKEEIDAAQIDRIEHRVWGCAYQSLDKGWQELKDSFKTT